MFKRSFFLAAVLGIASVTQAATNRPDGYTTICKTNESCSVAANTNVAFGASGLFTYKVLSGSFVCNVSTFGSDPNPAKSVKECSVPSGSGSSSSSSSSTSSSSSSGSANGPSNGTYSIVNRFNGLAMDVDSFSTADGANIMLWESWGAANQQWTINHIGNGAYTITNVNSGRVIDVLGGSTTAGDNIGQWGYWGGDTQHWYIAYTDGGYYTITSVYNQLALDAWAWGTGNGTDLRQWDYTGSDNQQWAFAPVSSSGSSSGSSSSGGGSGIGSACTSSTGTVYLNSTQVVNGTFDGGCKTYMPTWGDCGQSEGQDPVFRVESGTLRNVIIGDAGDGVHIYGNATVENVTWPNVCEDALTVKDDATVTINNITGYDASDKFFQMNAKATVTISNALIDGAGKIVRENGGKCYPVNVNITNSDISNVSEAIFRSDCSGSNFHISNSTLSNVDEVCYSGGSYASCGSN